MKTILISGASSGFGAMTARALADAGHTGLRRGARPARPQPARCRRCRRIRDRARRRALRSVALDVSDQASVDAAVAGIVGEAGGVDVLVHNAGHMVLGPTEAFTPEQLHDVFDVNAVSTQRLNRAVLPHMRERGDGLVIWVGSTSTRGGTPPYLAPYFAAKAAEDSLAVSYAVELSRFGIETSIVVPGAFTTGTNHFANAGHPADADVSRAYDDRYPRLMDDVGAALAKLMPADADPEEVARAIVGIVARPKGERPFRVHIDPADDGAEAVSAVADDIRRQFYDRIGFADLLHPVA